MELDLKGRLLKEKLWRDKVIKSYVTNQTKKEVTFYEKGNNYSTEGEEIDHRRS